MQLVTSGPLPTGSLVWRGRRGTFAFTVVSKATFSLAPGRSAPAPEQAPLRERDEFAGQDPARWLRGPADLVPYKMRADVVLVGQAYAPGGQPARAVRVRLAAFGVDKVLDVTGDRRRALDGRIVEAAPFVRMPIGWDRAGMSAQNLAGIPPGLPPDVHGTVPLPGVTGPDPAHDRGLSAGLGPVAPWWPGRREKLGQRGLAGLPPSWKDASVPDDADDALFQVAPPDQQPASIDLDGAIHLEHLHPLHAQLDTRLAPVSVQAAVERAGRAPAPLVLTADTVWFDTDAGICTVTWRGCLALTHPDELGTVRVVSALPEAASTAPRGRAAPSASKAGFDPRQTAAVDPAAVGSLLRALPFTPGPGAAGPPPEAASAGAPRRAAGAGAAPAAAWNPRETTGVDPSLIAREKLPFQPASERAAPPAFAFERSAAPPRRAYDPRETAAVDPAVAAAALASLPFDVPARASPPFEAPAPLPPGPPPLEVPAPPPPASLPFDVPPPPLLSAPAAASSAPSDVVEDEEPPPTERPASPPGDVPPPAFLGPAPDPAPASPAQSADPGAERKAEVERKRRAGEPLDGMDLSGLSLAGIDLEGASLAGATLERADLSGAKLRGANLSRATLTGADLSGADLSTATLQRASGAGAKLARARLGGAKLQEATLRDADLSEADLTEARLDGATLDGANLSRIKGAASTWERASLASCVLFEADLRGATFTEARCPGADFGRSQLGKSTFRGARCDGASFEDVTAPGARLIELCASSASFRRAKLESAQMRGATLAKACFAEAVLKRVVADDADLSDADLRRADLWRASLRDAVLVGATLTEANLEAADLRGADLSRANVSQARLAQARLEGIRKGGIEGL